MKTVFPNEVEVISHNHETLVLADVQGKCKFVAVTRDGFGTDYPIMYTHTEPKQTVWDNPEWFSKRFREKVHAYFLTAWKD